MKSTTVLLVLALVAAIVPAQLVVGDVGITGFSSTQIFIQHLDGTLTAVPVALPSTPHALLYDPSNPNTFLVAGSAYVGRITMTSPSTATYASITSSVGFISQLSFDGTQLVAADSGTDQMIRIDSVSGAVTPITSGAQPWGTNLNAGCFDPNTGDVYGGGQNGIWRIPFGSSTPVAFASGWNVSSFTTGLTIDPISLQVVATLGAPYAHLVRIDSLGNLTNIATSGPSAPNSVEFDHNGDFIVGQQAGIFSSVIFVPNGGGAPVPIWNGLGTGSGNQTWASPVTERFSMTATAPGSGAVTIGLNGIPPGTVEGYTIASFDTSLPVGTGPIFGFNPDATSFSLYFSNPVASAGNPVHWSWPVSAPLYPAAALAAGPGTVPPGAVVDLIAVAFNSIGRITPAPVVRLSIN